MRRNPITLLLVLAVVLVPGCATVAAPGSGSLDTGGPQDTSSTLRIMGTDFPYTDATVAAFERQHPEISVEYVKGAVSFEEGSAQTLLRSGSGPDLMLVNSGPGRVGMLADAGLIWPLDEVFTANGLAARFTPEVVRQTREGNDGRVYEIVEGLDVFQVYYNKKLFAAHGVEVPTDWDSFLTACTTLRSAGVKPLLAGARDNFAGGWLLGALVQASAGRDTMRDVIAGSGSFADPSIVRGGQMLADLLDKGCLDGEQAAALDGGQAEAAFWRGGGGMIVVPQGSMANARQDGVDVASYGSFPMPTTVPGAEALPTAGLALSWVVNNSTKSRSAVVEWLRWLASPEYLALTAQHGRTLVPAQVVPAGITLDPAVADGLEKVAKGTGFNPSVYLPDAAKEAWYQAVQGLLTGRISPEQAMRAVQDKLEASR
ncbi:ABC transporter substrate-binding protein [Kribbella italica]|uniref:Raffinose/stachyose/melibiose transport system substrate-binding protein n=1 Tax=Kribbella italica TaxID=1540520 RepID=A0A7W9JG80_9ACTN|nr:extracellular solute-binding protein [Kribbella italica]MBB5841571.1 raffinose/stachyose/melibiose transport system substrate-binding protein [Kribbella italica]